MNPCLIRWAASPILLALLLYAMPGGAQNLPQDWPQAEQQDPERDPTPVQLQLDPAALSEPSDPPGPADTQADALEAFVDGMVQTQLRQHQIAAISVAVVRDDAVQLARDYGSADLARTPAANDDPALFRIGSISKTFVWTLAMMLVERGQLDLDADVNSYLKNLQISDAFDAPVTMRQLMAHRAGFEDSFRVYTVSDQDPRSLSELLAAHQPGRVFAPGTRTSYSNWGSALAAQVVADVSGRDYAELLQSELLEPLGMSHTSWLAPSRFTSDSSPPLAIGYQRKNGALAPLEYMQLGAYWPVGGMAASAEDMSRWMRFHLNAGELDGVRLMRTETHALMWTRPFNDRPDGADVTLGFQDRSYRGLRLVGHGGATGAFISNMLLVPELGLGVFVSQNSADTRVPTQQIPELLIEYLTQPTLSVALGAEAQTDNALAVYAGSYLNNRRGFNSFSTLFAMGGVASVSAVSEDVLSVDGLGSDGSVQYRRLAANPDLFEAADGSRIAFIRDDSGQIQALADASGVHTLKRVYALATPNAFYLSLGVCVVLALSTLMGFFWRAGRAGKSNLLLAAIALIAALVTLGFVGVLLRLMQTMGTLQIHQLAGNYPLPAMLHLHYAGWAVAATALLMLLTLWPAWASARWSGFRALHFSAYTLAMVALTGLLWHWRIIAAPVY